LYDLPTHFIEIEHQIQLTHIPKETIQHLHEKMYSLQIRQFVIVRIDAGAEEESSVSSVYDLIVAELDKVGLVLLVSGCYETVDLGVLVACLQVFRRLNPRPSFDGKGAGEPYLAFKLYLLFIVVRRIPFRQAGFASVLISLILCVAPLVPADALDDANENLLAILDQNK
jgi:hypothetical protein